MGANGGLRGLARRRRLARRLRGWWHRSLLPIPAVYVVLAVALGFVVPAVDRHNGDLIGAGIGIQSARDVLTSTATGMIAFAGLVVASVLVVVQFAASQYSPRLVQWFQRDQVVKHAIGSFLAAPLFALVALRELERRAVRFSPDVTVTVSLVLLVAAAVLFLALLQRVIDRLRPRALYAAMAREGSRAVRRAYPAMLGAADPQDDAAPGGDGSRPGDAAAGGPEPGGDGDGAAWRAANPRELRAGADAGLVVAIDRELLLRAAVDAGVTIEVVPGIGELVAPRTPFVRIHGDGAVDEEVLRCAVVVGEERALEHDPEFALRIVVDTAIRALSPAVNDPTTAVQGLDAIEVIVRELLPRDLDTGVVRGEDRAVRVVWRAPTWEDLLDLAFEEIRAYGADAPQIARRLRALLADLHRVAPPARRPAIELHQERLEAAVAFAFQPGAPGLAVARGSDRIGIGLVSGG